jgi:hypothetical protein
MAVLATAMRDPNVVIRYQAETRVFATSVRRAVLCSRSSGPWWAAR